MERQWLVKIQNVGHSTLRLVDGADACGIGMGKLIENPRCLLREDNREK